jgi:hypothetical protein
MERDVVLASSVASGIKKVNNAASEYPAKLVRIYVVSDTYLTLEETMPTFQGFGNLQTPQDLFEKLQHDFSRIKNDPLDTYAAFDFFVTAEHMLDWVYPDAPGMSQKAQRKAVRASERLLQITSHIANGSKHFITTDPRHDSVENIEANSGGFDPRVFSTSAFSAEAFKFSGLTVVLDDGSHMHVFQLAEQVLALWWQRLSIS